MIIINRHNIIYLVLDRMNVLQTTKHCEHEQHTTTTIFKEKIVTQLLKTFTHINNIIIRTIKIKQINYY
jgi:hypothetical protein